jgi:hypothetical protein
MIKKERKKKGERGEKARNWVRSSSCRPGLGWPPEARAARERTSRVRSKT